MATEFKLDRGPRALGQLQYQGYYEVHVKGSKLVCFGGNPEFNRVRPGGGKDFVLLADVPHLNHITVKRGMLCRCAGRLWQIVKHMPTVDDYCLLLQPVRVVPCGPQGVLAAKYRRLSGRAGSAAKRRQFASRATAHQRRADTRIVPYVLELPRVDRYGSGDPWTVYGYWWAYRFLPEWLRPMGEAELVAQGLPTHYRMRIKLPTTCTVTDSSKRRPERGVSVNADTLTCHALAPVRFNKLPKLGDMILDMWFELDVSTRDVPPGVKPSLEILAQRIKDFAEEARYGFYYHWPKVKL